MAKAKSVYAMAAGATQVTPQTEAIPGREKDMKKNNAGGVVFTITPFQMLERFLILGSDQPSYYASAKKLTADNSKNIRECLALDGKKTVDTIVAISVAGRAPKNDPALFALAVCSVPEFGSAEIAQYATSQLHKVARTGTMLRQYAEYVSPMRGWGRNLKNAFGSWFTDKNENQLAYQLAKYQNREGWTAKDLLSLAHVKTADPRKAALLAWANVGGLDALQTQAQTWTRSIKKWKGDSKRTGQLTQVEIDAKRGQFQNAYNILSGDTAPKLIAAYEAAKKATSANEIVKLIRDGGLTHEMIPTQFKTDASVWEALLEKMPVTAMVRNLGVMSKVGLLTVGSNASKAVITRLHDQGFLQKGRIHPVAIMLAQDTYRQGKGQRGSSTWTPVPQIVTALEDAFYLAFSNVTPTGKTVYIGLDVSGSMSWASSFIKGTQISAAKAGAAMMLLMARTEPNYYCYAFSTGMQEIGITAQDTLESAMAKAGRMSAGGTDCAQPMIHALGAKLDVDAFITITDNESWAGSIQPIQALKQYRSQRNKPEAALIAMAMSATQYSIADPKDPFNLDVVGFDANAPVLVTDFIRGNSAGSTEDTEDSSDE
jgi:60 kDa SS-A/Ro ribonucleoprotein